ncbi:MAG: VWA domain-containing protein [Acidimicrobiia bacterium]|nr:VWA domain-containing protein [Acidimicrobiia bacterium]
MTGRPADAQVGDALADRIVRLGRALQLRGIDVALSEVIDASRAATLIDLGSRSELRTALKATMIKDPLHVEAFDAAFDRLFPSRRADMGGGSTTDEPAADPVGRLVDGTDLAGLAADLVDDHAGLDGELRGERHHMHRVYRAADLARLMSEARKLDPNLPVDELRRRLEELKRLIAADIRGQIGETDPTDIIGDIEDVDFLEASRNELEEIRAAIKPLARRLASRFARRRQARNSGRVNLRRTARKSLATGGVPIDVATNRPRAHRPNLWVLCDISGSVAEFSLFTLSLMSALSAEVQRTRSFVFVDAIDDITQLLDATDHGIEPWQIMRNTNVIGADGHSDYGAVFKQWWDETGRTELRSSSTVIITGDARNNYRDTEVGILAEIAARAKRVYWLNPEPRDEWDDGDSVMSTYADHCHEVFEVRNLRQLATCVEQIL